MQPFIIHSPQGEKVPILISVPHCGTEIPQDIAHLYRPQQTKSIDDTDWFVDRLYDFAPQMGITMICARYSRWVIDLNRDPKGAALYNDGRIITALTPTTNFAGQDIYVDTLPDQQEITRRLEKYYWPYHNKITQLLHELQQTFSQVLFFDAHSIRRFVPTIRSQPFPDLILGNQDQKTADVRLIKTALKVLESSSYTVQHNDPFKGGALTRSIGNPSQGIHALQLEMTKVNYMNDNELVYHDERAENMRLLLQKMFNDLTNDLRKFK